MMGKENVLITIDLAQFKLHVNIEDKISMSLHFDSESRRFYLCVIALVLLEMKKLGEITSIPLEKHYDTLAILNETVGGQAGSSIKKKLLARIYKKWKDDLPDLEHSPLFRVLGKKKEYDDAARRTYEFTDEEKDAWANLFDYKGSHENIRLRFSIDKLGATLDDVLVTFPDDANLSTENGWDGFLKSLQKSTEEERDKATIQASAEAQAVSSEKGRAPWYRRKAVQALIIVVIAVASAAVIWNFYPRPSLPQFEPASEKKMPYPLPEKPSIAVMPFVNMSGDPEQDYFSDGMTETIITALSKIPQMFVIARNSTFTYKGKPVKVQQVAEELGVRYVLEGSVQKAGARVRITAQLVDALKGHHLWAEQYDRKITDIFTVQDEITRNIVLELRVNLGVGEQELLYQRHTDNPEVYGYFLRGVHYMYRHTKEDIVRARQMFEKAVELDPEFALGYAYLGGYHISAVVFGFSKSPAQSLKLAAELAQKGLAIDDSLAYAYDILGFVYLWKRQHEKAIAEGEKAIALSPNYAKSYNHLGIFLYFSGRPEEAIEPLKRAIRLDPIPLPIYFTALAQAYRMTGRYEESIAELKRALQRDPDYILAYTGLAVTYAHMGRELEARAAAAEVRRIHPEFSAEHWPKTLPYKNKEDLARNIDGLRKAGLLE